MEDQRWNKVGIILNILFYNIKSNFVSTNAFLVWVDSDLIILDMEMKMEEITDKYSWADLILSEDTHGEVNGIANTGFMLIRVSEWSKSFFSLWWTDFDDRSKGMDQHVFHRLWTRNALNMTSHVAILPPDTLNSMNPPWKHQKSTNKVLHLEGTSSTLRETILSFAFEQLCTTFSGGASHVPPQLGLDREKLDIFFNSYCPVLLKCKSLLNSFKLTVNNSFNSSLEVKEFFFSFLLTIFFFYKLVSLEFERHFEIFQRKQFFLFKR
jgi:hypothetical protein